MVMRSPRGYDLRFVLEQLRALSSEATLSRTSPRSRRRDAAFLAPVCSRMIAMSLFAGSPPARCSQFARGARHRSQQVRLYRVVIMMKRASARRRRRSSLARRGDTRMNLGSPPHSLDPADRLEAVELV
jgi:hypothetical protein